MRRRNSEAATHTMRIIFGTDKLLSRAGDVQYCRLHIGSTTGKGCVPYPFPQGNETISRRFLFVSPIMHVLHTGIAPLQSWKGMIFCLCQQNIVDASDKNNPLYDPPVDPSSLYSPGFFLLFKLVSFFVDCAAHARTSKITAEKRKREPIL